MLLDTPSYKKLFKHMIILSNSIKVEFFEGPKLVKDNLQKIEKSLDLFFKEFNLSKIDVEVGFATKSEMKNIDIVRKSIIAKTTIRKGDVLSESNLDIKRPGDGISPMRWDEILGSFSQRDYEEDDLI